MWGHLKACLLVVQIIVCRRIEESNDGSTDAPFTRSAKPVHLKGWKDIPATDGIPCSSILMHGGI